MAVASFGRRVWAFLDGDMLEAEAMAVKQQYATPDWIVAASEDAGTSLYAQAASKRAADEAEGVSRRLQDRASSLLSTILTLFPLAMAATIFLLPRSDASGWRWFAFAFFVSADLSLLMAAIMAFLASGLARGAGLNPAKYKVSKPPSLAELYVVEADAWYYAAEVAMESGHRKASDLFAARRWIITALLAVVLAAPFALLARSTADAVSTYRNQMPGAINVPQAFTDAHVRYGGVDYGFNGSGFNSNWNEFGLSIPSGTGGLTMTTWDKKCAF